jgi:hypothetical protein
VQYNTHRDTLVICDDIVESDFTSMASPDASQVLRREPDVLVFQIRTSFVGSGIRDLRLPYKVSRVLELYHDCNSGRRIESRSADFSEDIHLSVTVQCSPCSETRSSAQTQSVKAAEAKKGAKKQRWGVGLCVKTCKSQDLLPFLISVLSCRLSWNSST